MYNNLTRGELCDILYKSNLADSFYPKEKEVIFMSIDETGKKEHYGREDVLIVTRFLIKEISGKVENMVEESKIHT